MEEIVKVAIVCLVLVMSVALILTVVFGMKINSLNIEINELESQLELCKQSVELCVEKYNEVRKP